jgi:transaldolase
MTKLHDLARAGQSVWLDFVRRSHTESGKLAEMVTAGIRGVTSNPTIFEAAVTQSSDYDQEIRDLAESDLSDDRLFERLALADIGRAADVLRPVYDESGGRDGFASIEVRPELADDTEGTVAEARRLWSVLDRPNIMIKVPATAAGIPAVQRLIAEGVNVNVTLIFSATQYEAVTEAHLSGLERRVQQGQPLESVASVASFFVSRVDTAVDAQLDAASDLRGTIAVANAKLAYQLFGAVTGGSRWRKLSERGAQVQRPLWASTGTKNPDYSDTLYVDELIGPDTVNTVPPKTLEAFLDHGRTETTLTEEADQARARIARLPELGVDLAAVTDHLLTQGVAAFASAYDGVVACVAAKRSELVA